jgi:hypothetical protein
VNGRSWPIRERQLSGEKFIAFSAGISGENRHICALAVVAGLDPVAVLPTVSITCRSTSAIEL